MAACLTTFRIEEMGMEDNRTQDPFSRWDQPAGQQPYEPQQPYVQPQQPYVQPQQPYVQPQQPYVQPQQSYATQQPSQPFAQPEGRNPYTAQPGAAQDLSQYASYQPQYYGEGQAAQSQQVDTPFGTASYSPYGNRSTPRASTSDELSDTTGKHRAGLYLGIAGALLVIAGVLTAWMLGWFHSRSGTYVWDDYAKADMTAKIEIDGDKATITMVSKEDVRTVNCDVEFSGDTVKFVYNGKVLTCDYDRRNGIITEKDDFYTGVDIVFEKE